MQKGERVQKKPAIPAGTTPRKFVPNDGAISFFCDYTQVIVTEEFVILQHYETIPDLPGDDAKVRGVTSRLRATVTMSEPSMARLLKLSQELMAQVSKDKK
jgi:hypothetical protein